MKGEIKKLVQDRGFGFITAEDQKEVFFHRSALAGDEFDTLHEGAAVEFNLESGPKGFRAADVKVTES
ncbi:MAG: cold-shock protein [Dehalococcoidia bacterium]